MAELCPRGTGGSPIDAVAKERITITTENPSMPFEYDVIIPTLNAAKFIEPLLRALAGQTLPPGEILVVDSSSDDDTVSRAKRFPGVRVLSVDRRDFDHGGTRDMAIKSCDSPFVVLMTQDALPSESETMAVLLKPFEDPAVAAVCARQVARPESSARERAVREYRYPPTSATWTREDVPELGMRAYLLSDVCAAYRREAYLAVGGFERPLSTNEDMLIASDLLKAGYRLAYCSEARVWHSHDYTLRQEYRRNRLIGGFLAQYGDRFQSGALGEGVHLALKVTGALWKGRAWGEIVPFWLNCAARLLGNRAGRRAMKRRGLSDG